MTTYLIINAIVSVCLVLICIYLISKQFKSKENINETNTSSNNILNRITSIDWKVKGLLALAFMLIILAFFAPFILTRPAINSDFNFSTTGQIGDTVGGLMNPLIALSSVIVTGLAFYIQYKANLLQRELFLQEQEENKKQLQEQIDNQNRQIKVQKFESQFYEMLKLHRENVTEMKITGYDFEESKVFKKFEKVTEGRKVFVTMKTELECILALFSKDRKLNKEGFQKCYKLFFSGLEEFHKSFPEEDILVGLLKEARESHEHPDPKKIKNNQDRKEFLEYAKLYFNYKPFSGHSSRLGHYFRHLYLTVKSVANSEIITDYEERMQYLRILRAQLSNHEQILLFYNWLSEYGADWENEKHSFFTEYCMIHNLWYENLFENLFIEENVKLLRTKEVKLRSGKMFEIDK
jgi:hypothetical protein